MAALSPVFDHELVNVVRDKERGLTAVIAIHSTARGPAMGGVRWRDYPCIDDAMFDALRLSEAMTLKNAVAGLPLGGGKAVIVDPGDRDRTQVMQAFGDSVNELGGRYIAAEDIGTTPQDMSTLALRTQWVAGLPTSSGGFGDPSPATARTVFGAIQAAQRLTVGSGDLTDRLIGIVGTGHVGSALARLLHGSGAQLVLADTDAAKAQALAEELGASTSDAEALLVSPLDVLAPCAVGEMITLGIADRLRCRVVAGAANNILADDQVAERLHSRGILFVPDFIANAGGVIQVAGEYLGQGPDEIAKAIDAAVGRCAEGLDQAMAAGEPPVKAARSWAAARLLRDPAAAA